LRNAGYRTLWSGKHHGIENPVTRGFDRYYGLRDGASNHFNPGLQREGEGKPFFLYLSYTAPHDPLMDWPEDIAKYEGKYEAGYEAIRAARFQKQLDMGLIKDREELFKLALLGKKHTRQQPIFWQWRRGQTVRSGKWKLVREGLDQPWELFNLKTDPSEEENLADKKAEKMEVLFLDWAQ